MKTLIAEDLAAAYEGSYYTILGTGGSIDEWVENYETILKEREIGKPVEWFQTTGREINLYAAKIKGGYVHSADQFKLDLGVLIFPLTDLNLGRLAGFKIQMEDRWFDDIVQNMRPRRG